MMRSAHLQFSTQKGTRVALADARGMTPALKGFSEIACVLQAALAQGALPLSSGEQ
jgi:hypothetical protein